jgi:hypothetical protein
VKETFQTAVMMLVASLIPFLSVSAQRVEAPASAVVATDSSTLVFVECTDCDGDYLRTELTFVTLVRDRQLADVALLVTALSTASGGRQFSIHARAGGRVADSTRTTRIDTLYVNTRPDATANDQRQALVRAIKVALLPWIARSLDLAHVDLQYLKARPATTGAGRLRDPWNQWVFRVNASGSFAGDDNYRRVGGDGNLRASRITEQLKVELTTDGQFSRERFRLADSTFAISVRQSWASRAFVAHALGPHWSAGVRGHVASSIFENTRLDSRASAAVEYSLFPYREATQRQVIARYTMGLRATRYVDTTVFGRLRETRPVHDLLLATDIRQPWGNMYGAAVWSQYLHDGRRRRLSLDFGFEYRIVAGLSIGAGLNYARTRDQLNVPGGNLSDQERLLQLRELQTGYSASFSLGFSYTFGSVFSNVVNPRFGL